MNGRSGEIWTRLSAKRVFRQKEVLREARLIDGPLDQRRQVMAHVVRSFAVEDRPGEHGVALEFMPESEERMEALRRFVAALPTSSPRSTTLEHIGVHGSARRGASEARELPDTF